VRILFLNYEYPPLGGGAANATAYILKEFSQIPDLEVDLVTSAHDDKFSTEKIGERITIHKIPIGDKSQNLHYQSQKDLIVYAWKAYHYSKKLIREKNYELSHSFFGIPCGCVSLLLKWKYKVPYIVSLRGSDVPGYSDRFPLIYFFLTPLIKLIWKKSAAVFSNSQGLKELALKTNPQQEIGIIFNGIDISEFKPAENLDSSKIICISRLTDRKGINYLIEAFEKLKNDKFKLVIVGEGNQKEELEKMVENLKISNRVEFLGRVEHSKLPEVYRWAGVFVLPSLNEGMSNTMLEALASGLPLIATDTGGTRELINDGENGFIIKMKDSDDIKEKIEKLMNNRELQIAMGINSRKRAEELSWKNVAENYLNEYKKCEIKK